MVHRRVSHGCSGSPQVADLDFSANARPRGKLYPKLDLLHYQSGLKYKQHYKSGLKYKQHYTQSTNIEVLHSCIRTGWQLACYPLPTIGLAPINITSAAPCVTPNRFLSTLPVHRHREVCKSAPRLITQQHGADRVYETACSDYITIKYIKYIG